MVLLVYETVDAVIARPTALRVVESAIAVDPSRKLPVIAHCEVEIPTRPTALAASPAVENTRVFPVDPRKVVAVG